METSDSLRDFLDQASRDRIEWIIPLSSSGSTYDHAVKKLYTLLEKAAHFEVRKRARVMGIEGHTDLFDLAVQTANDSLMAILSRIKDFEGRSRFTTWAYKFVVNISGVAVRRLAWKGNDVALPDNAIEQVTDLAQNPATTVEQSDLLTHISKAMKKLTGHQQKVLVSLAIDGVPIDVLAENLSTTRNALYKTLHDARRSLRKTLEESGVAL